MRAPKSNLKICRASKGQLNRILQRKLLSFYNFIKHKILRVLTLHMEGTIILSLVTALLDLRRWGFLSPGRATFSFNLLSILLRTSACCLLANWCSCRNRSFSAARFRLLCMSSSRRTMQSSPVWPIDKNRYRKTVR